MSFDVTERYTDIQRIVRSKFSWTGLDMDDLTQAVYAAILRKNQTTPYDATRSKHSSYIYLVAHSTALNLLRQQQKCVPETVVETAQLNQLKGADDALCWNAAFCDEIERFLSVAPLLRLAFRLERQEKTAQEIAKIFGWKIDRTRDMLADMHTILRMRFSA